MELEASYDNRWFDLKVRDVGNKIPDVSRLVTNIAFNTKNRESWKIIIVTTTEFNKLSSELFNPKLKNMKLATNTRLATTMYIIFWDFLVLYQIFFSPQVKQSVIINNKHGIYELPQELPNNFRLRIPGNYERSGKSQSIIEL